MVETKWYRCKFSDGRVLLVDANKVSRWDLFDLQTAYGKVTEFKEISLEWGIDYDKGAV